MAASGAVWGLLQQCPQLPAAYQEVMYVSPPELSLGLCARSSAAVSSAPGGLPGGRVCEPA